MYSHIHTHSHKPSTQSHTHTLTHPYTLTYTQRHIYSYLHTHSNTHKHTYTHDTHTQFNLMKSLPLPQAVDLSRFPREPCILIRWYQGTGSGQLTKVVLSLSIGTIVLLATSTSSTKIICFFNKTSGAADKNKLTTEWTHLKISITNLYCTVFFKNFCPGLVANMKTFTVCNMESIFGKTHQRPIFCMNAYKNV